MKNPRTLSPRSGPMSDGDLKKIGLLIDEKLVASEQRLSSEIGKFIEENILTALEEKATSAEVNRLQNSLDRFGDKLESKSPVI